MSKTTAHTSPWARPSGANRGLISRSSTHTDRARRNWLAAGKGFLIAAVVVVVTVLAGYATAQPFDAAPVAVVDAARSSPPDAPTPAEAGSGVGTTIDAPDPVTDPVGFGQKVLALYRSGALVPAVILLIFGIAVFLHKRLGWFSKGKIAVYFAAGVAALTLLAEAASRGTTPSAGVFVAAIAMAVGMVLNTELGGKKKG